VHIVDYRSRCTVRRQC